MTMRAPLNPIHDQLAEYDDLIEAAAARYAETGQGVAYVLYEKLIFLRQSLVSFDANPVLRAHIAAVRHQLQRYYRLGDVAAPVDAATVVAGQPGVKEFDREVFERRGYATAARTIAGDLVTLTCERDGSIEVGRMYLYVIDDRDGIIVWPHAFRYHELAFGVDRARVGDVPVAHPMLVPDRLRAAAAGEVVFTGDDRLTGAIVNTRSGHFRPPPSCAPLVHTRFAATLKISHNDIDVIVVS